MKHFLISFLLFLIVLTFSASQVFAQNKAGINIGDHFEDFDRAAEIVGSGGWIVIMACPGDGDKIAKMASDHPEINIVIRGHYPSQTPPEENNKLAKLWGATLNSISFPKKVYFMPWNEPNHENEGGGSSAGSKVYQYGEFIKSHFESLGILGSKVILLSPMVDKLNPSFIDSSFFTNPGGKSGFYNLFQGSSINEYDQFSPGPCTAVPPQNNCKYDEIGIPGAFYSLETGVAGTCTPPCYRDNELRQMLDRSWQKWSGDANFKMFAIFSYDPHRADWDIFSNGSKTVEFLKNISSSSGGCCTQNASSSTGSTSLKLCPGKLHSFFIDNEDDCSDCGGFSLQTCIPIAGNNPADEYGRKAELDLKEKATYSKNDESCLEGIIEGKIDVADLRIPLVKGLNKYFLGSSSDDSFAYPKSSADPFKNAGAFRLLAPKEYQDELKIKFLDEIDKRGMGSKYGFLKIKGMKPVQIKNKFIQIQNKSSGQRSSEDQEFLSQVWSLIPLFANEESEGHLFLERGPADLDVSAVRTSVPEVYRLNNVSNFMAAMLVPGFKDRSQVSLPQQNQNLAQTDGNKVLQASDEICPITLTEEKINAKKALSGPGETVCTNIKGEENKLLKTRGINNDAEESCSAGGCEFDPQTQKESDVLNRCCGNQGKCLKNQDGGFYCEERGCGSCWGAATSHGCCVSASAPKTVTFTDSKLNLKNRAPYLAGIEENLIGQGGLFKIFLPSTETNQNIFEDVAGEAENINVNIRDIQTRLKKGRNARFEAEPEAAKTGVLFYKLGTFQIVKNFIGQLLSP